MKESSYIKLFILDSPLYNSRFRSNIPDYVNLREQNSNSFKPLKCQPSWTQTDYFFSKLSILKELSRPTMKNSDPAKKKKVFNLRVDLKKPYMNVLLKN